MKSLEEANPPVGVSLYLKAMWYYRKGDWNRAHLIAQEIPDQTAAWIHAFLHRDEGDIWNADYWYRRAGRVRPDLSLEEEWNYIVETLLETY